MPRRLALMLLGVLSVACVSTPSINPSAGNPPSGTRSPIELPVLFYKDCFFVHPTTRDGGTLAFFTATGGGLFIQPRTVSQLGLPLIAKKMEGGGTMDWVRLPDFQTGGWIPGLDGNEGLLPVSPVDIDPGTYGDGLLGPDWFAGRVWTFDYPAGKLWLRAAGDLPNGEPAHRVSLGFLSDSAGKRGANTPRIQVRVDGEALDLLLDTGALMSMSESAREALADAQPPERAASFITVSTYERWHQRHPDWRVIEDADASIPGTTLIEVPRLEVAGHEVGPVWFTTRPDAGFREHMSRLMDKPIEGALGGNALKFFRVTVDYVQAVAVFERAPSKG